jgi:phosphate/phosphite/phosphonate ABC transporter binding protein
MSPPPNIATLALLGFLTSIAAKPIALADNTSTETTQTSTTEDAAAQEDTLPPPLETVSAMGPSFELQQGAIAPPFSMVSIGGEKYAIAQRLGGHAFESKQGAVLVFFSTDCLTCVGNLKAFQKLESQWRAMGIDLVHIGVLENGSTLREFFEESPIAWPVLADPHGIVAKRYGATSLPHWTFVDSNRKIALQVQHGQEENLKRLNEEVEKRAGQKLEILSTQTTSAKSTYEEEKPTLSFGRPPSSKDSHSRWHNLGQHLGQQARATVNLSTTPSYALFREKVLKGGYDILSAGPLLCLEASTHYEPSIQLARQGTFSYFGIIFSKRTPKIRKLKHLRRKKIAMVSPASTSGGIYPQKVLVDAGFRLDKNIEIVWVGSHTEVARAVKKGLVHAGACYEDCRDEVWPDLRTKMRSTRVLHYTDKIPPEMIMLRKDIPGPLKKRLHAALRALSSERSVLATMSQGESTITDVSPVGVGGLMPLRNILDELKKTPGARLPE